MSARNVLAVKRGVNNLLYVVVMTSDGNILHHESLNIINGCNYKEKIDIAANNKKENAKEWKTIHSSDGLKEGYISYAVRKVADLMLEYNAVLVMEDLSVNLKYRSGLDNQVFSKFENAIIAKLSNLSKKTTCTAQVDPYENGGVLYPYMLTDTDVKIDKTKQNGLVFLVGSQYSVAIDQNTGFINKLKLHEHKTIEKRRAYMNRFTSFKYSENDDMFILKLSYSNFEFDMPVDDWTLYSHGKRIVAKKNKLTGKKNFQLVDLTQYIKDAFDATGIAYDAGEDLLNIDDKHINKVYNAISLIMQMTNKANIDGTEYSFISSPVKDANGEFYETELINGCDYNGCLTLAKRGYYHISKLINGEKLYCSTDEYIRLMQ